MFDENFILGRETDIDGWAPVWYGASAMVGLGATIFLAFGTSEQQETIMNSRKFDEKAESESSKPEIDILDD